MKQKTNLIERRYICFMLALVVAAGVNFVRYRALNLNATGTSFTAFFVDYEEKT